MMRNSNVEYWQSDHEEPQTTALFRLVWDLWFSQSPDGLD